MRKRNTQPGSTAKSQSKRKPAKARAGNGPASFSTFAPTKDDKVASKPNTAHLKLAQGNRRLLDSLHSGRGFGGNLFQLACRLADGKAHNRADLPGRDAKVAGLMTLEGLASGDRVLAGKATAKPPFTLKVSDRTVQLTWSK